MKSNINTAITIWPLPCTYLLRVSAWGQVLVLGRKGWFCGIGDSEQAIDSFLTSVGSGDEVLYVMCLGFWWSLVSDLDSEERTNGAAQSFLVCETQNEKSARARDCCLEATCTVLLYERYSWARTHAPANYRGCRTNCGIARVERGLQLRQRPPILYCQCTYTYARSPTHMGS